MLATDLSSCSNKLPIKPSPSPASWPSLLTLFALNPRKRQTDPAAFFLLYSFHKLYAAHGHPPPTEPIHPLHPYRSGRQATTTLSTFATPPQLQPIHPPSPSSPPKRARRQASDRTKRTKAIEREGESRSEFMLSMPTATT